MVVVAEILVNFDHRRIDTAGAAAAAGDEERKLIRVQAQGLTPFFPRHGEDILADGIARIDQNILTLETGCSLFIAQGYAIDKAAQNRIGNARDDVLFLDQCRHTAQAGCQKDWTADETARPDDNIWFEFADNAFCLDQAACRLAQGDEVAEGNLPFQAPHVESDERQSFFRDQCIFQADFGADVEKFGRLNVGNRPGNGNRRVDMAACATSGNNDSTHVPSSCLFLLNIVKWR